MITKAEYERIELRQRLATIYNNKTLSRGTMWRRRRKLRKMCDIV